MVMPGILLGRLVFAGSSAVPTITATFAFGNDITPAQAQASRSMYGASISRSIWNPLVMVAWFSMAVSSFQISILSELKIILRFTAVLSLIT